MEFMQDRVREMMDVWSNRGNQAAYDLSQKLLSDIENMVNDLRKQSVAIKALEQHLISLGVKPRPQAPNLDIVSHRERPRLIIEAATSLWRKLPDGEDLIKVQDVLEELNGRGLDLGVRQPMAVIGTVLSNSNDFRKIARNTFEYVGHLLPTDDIDDLPF